ncbi:unnamed protein product [Rhizoctonia solani]|uniref:O-methylsterigmatocystin oxidoreductase n=1 Tax=Rhizoctonia solani TaxID=456999 RepID=A0A8H3AQ62_9AGAM|nr:unnamed protein product [Rhizoctonia solani]
MSKGCIYKVLRVLNKSNLTCYRFDWSGQPVLLGYGEPWRNHRRMLNNWLNSRAVTQFHSIQEQQIQPLLSQLACLQDDPYPFEKFKHTLFVNMASSMMKLGYGYTIQGYNDPIFQDIQQTSHHIEFAGMFTNFLVNIFPSLSYVPDWFPGTCWKRTAREWRVQKERAQSVPYQWTKAQVDAGTTKPSILDAHLQNPKLTSHINEGDKESYLKKLASVIVSAGIDTVIIQITSTVLIAFVAAMVLNTNVQAKAQKELDDVLGPTSLPTMADRAQLPYIQNLIQEVLRWQPPAPTAIPHTCWRDDNYEGYDIKKGTIVIGNVWAMTRDEITYNDPETFDSDRFQDPDVPPAPAFGWGRRKCPGIHFAEATLFITVASLLVTFTFSKKRGPDGREIVPQIEGVSNSIILELKPFDFELKLRSPYHQKLILE